jgi:hypothetical protein
MISSQMPLTLVRSTFLIIPASSLQAFKEAQLKVKKLNNIIDKMEERRNKPEVLIKDLVSSFLIPDVQRKKIQRQGRIN